VALEALYNEATIAESAEVSASCEPDLRLEKAAARRRGCGFRPRNRQGARPRGCDQRTLRQNRPN
jgi:hypothetical protein